MRQPMIPVMVRLPADLVKRLDKVAEGVPDVSRSLVIRWALHEGLPTVEARKTR